MTASAVMPGVNRAATFATPWYAHARYRYVAMISNAKKATSPPTRVSNFLMRKKLARSRLNGAFIKEEISGFGKSRIADVMNVSGHRPFPKRERPGTRPSSRRPRRDYENNFGLAYPRLTRWARSCFGSPSGEAGARTPVAGVNQWDCCFKRRGHRAAESTEKSRRAWKPVSTL